MARPSKETDLKTLAQNRYDQLMSKRNEIEEELKGLEGYLKAVGEKQVRGKPERKLQPKAQDVAGPQMAKVKSRRSRGAKGGSATASIISLIERSEKGISIDEMMKQTGLPRNTVNGILNRMKKERKVEAIKRGVYVKQNSAGQRGTRTQVRGKKSQAIPESGAVPKKAQKPKSKAPAKRSRRAKGKAKGVEKKSATESVQQKAE